jgi:hypothetical protein
MTHTSLRNTESGFRLSALLARDQFVPIVHNSTYEALREVSPLLGSLSGLSTAENTMTDAAAKLAELIAF